MHSSHILLLNTIIGFASAYPKPSFPLGSQWPLVNANDDEEDRFDLEPNAKYAFSGITTFFQLPSVQCLAESGPVDDILVVGFPFDTATSYRTGTRFGPNAIRQGSRAASLA